MLRVERERGEVRPPVEMVHLVATFCNLLLALAVVQADQALSVFEPIAFCVVGLLATVGYSVLFLVVGEFVGERYLSVASARETTEDS